MTEYASPIDIDLSGAWQLAVAEVPPTAPPTSAEELLAAGLALRPCTVPGNLELDLLDTEARDSLFQGMNVLKIKPFERLHAWYVHAFSAEPPAGRTAELVFDGIDCYADVYLNGVHLGSTDNMLIAHTFPVDGLLQAENELLVYIRPALAAAADYPYPPQVAAGAINFESLYVRKAPHMYGWDIMPRAVSAGLWRPVSLRYRPVERLESVYLVTEWLSEDHQVAGLDLRYHVNTDSHADDNYQIVLTMICGTSCYHKAAPLRFAAGRLPFTVQSPRLWWPHGAGEPALYQVTVQLLKNGTVIDERHFTHGIRMVKLQHTAVTNEQGEGEFCFYLNGERIFVRGSNWVPLDAFHSRDAERLDAAFALAVQANCNLLRCWGGNVYESDRFFELCDVHGIMVWQDFAMACAVYPQDSDFQARLAVEARAVVRRLRVHPSLVLWSGDNECDEAYTWSAAGDPNCNVLTRQVLREVLRAEDGARPYLPSSPYLGPEGYAAGERYVPEAHLWGPRDYFKSDFYMHAPAHFTSEIGYLATPVASSIAKFITPEHRWPLREDDPEWRLHCTSPDPGWHNNDYRVECLNRHLQAVFGPAPAEYDAYIFASQAAQVEAYKFFIERFRGTKWRRTGIIWWNLIDGWPQFSDAVVDYYFMPKLAFYFIANVQQPLLVLCQEADNGRLPLVVTNDTRRDVPLQYTLRDLDGDAILAEGEAVAAANALTPLASIPIDPDAQRCFLIEWQSDLGRGQNHYLAGPPPFDPRQYARWFRMFSAGIVDPEHETLATAVRLADLNIAR